MARVAFTIHSDLAPERVLAVATDFSEKRPHYWPTIDPKVYRVHGTTATSAEVTEGSAVFGGIWAREAYDWSEPGVVCATVQDSNVFRPGGRWQLRVTPRPDGGCRIDVLNHRQARRFKGRLVGTMLTLMGAKVLSKQLRQTLDIVTKEAGADSLATQGAQ